MVELLCCPSHEEAKVLRKVSTVRGGSALKGDPFSDRCVPTTTVLLFRELCAACSDCYFFGTDLLLC